MIRPEFFIEALREKGIDCFAGVPDSLLKNICAYITDHFDAEHNIIAANEGAAVGLAAGVERLILLTNKELKENRPISIIPVDESEAPGGKILLEACPTGVQHRGGPQIVLKDPLHIYLRDLEAGTYPREKLRPLLAVAKDQGPRLAVG